MKPDLKDCPLVVESIPDLDQIDVTAGQIQNLMPKRVLIIQSMEHMSETVKIKLKIKTLHLYCITVD